MFLTKLEAKAAKVDIVNVGFYQDVLYSLVKLFVFATEKCVSFLFLEYIMLPQKVWIFRKFINYPRLFFNIDYSLNNSIVTQIWLTLRYWVCRTLNSVEVRVLFSVNGVCYRVYRVEKKEYCTYKCDWFWNTKASIIEFVYVWNCTDLLSFHLFLFIIYCLLFIIYYLLFIFIIY